MKELFFQTLAEWRNWLAKNYNKENGLWLIFYKKETGLCSIDYESAVEEALCFGWIDSIIKNLDQSRYARKFTPRKDNSRWSEINKNRVARLIKNGRMTNIGLTKIKAAKESGLWNKSDRPTISDKIPEAFNKALDNNSDAKTFFESLAPTYRKHYLGWITMAKREETREKRIKESIQLLNKKQKLGLK
jgi:uncharacterized protein YdeI (YjbR/CyaY-like superfamily)